LQKGLKRTNNPNSKLSEKEIKEIANSNLKQIELAKKYNISQSNVSYIKIREENLKLNYGI
jgi:DNA-binding transcriptional regulator YiaG